MFENSGVIFKELKNINKFHLIKLYLSVEIIQFIKSLMLSFITNENFRIIHNLLTFIIESL